jgi:hypothetical protein
MQSISGILTTIKWDINYKLHCGINSSNLAFRRTRSEKKEQIETRTWLKKGESNS